MEEELYLPVLHSFANNNIYTGSLGNFRFKITPNVVMANKKEVDMAASSIRAEYWHGPFCYEKSDIEGEKVFPMEEESREQIRGWLLENR